MHLVVLLGKAFEAESNVAERGLSFLQGLQPWQLRLRFFRHRRCGSLSLGCCAGLHSEPNKLPGSVSFTNLSASWPLRKAINDALAPIPDRTWPKMALS